MDNGQDVYLRPETIRKRFDVTPCTLREWANSGKIKSIRTPGGNILYLQSDIYSAFGISDTKQRVSYIYCRVSSKPQAADLERQVEYICNEYPGIEVLRDIGSGINYKKPGFKKLLKEVLQGNVQRIYITDKDRLLRFGYELFEEVCKAFGTEIVVLNTVSSTEELSERELADDLLTICNVFVAKKNGKRASRNRKQRIVQQESTHQEQEC